jgi:neutral ceramidase
MIRGAEDAFLAGAGGCLVDPPLGLPMAGVVRREGPAAGRLGHLEVTAAAFSMGSTRVILCGVDTVGIQAPEADELRRRVASATGAGAAGILLNWNHTHHAPPGCRSASGMLGERDPEPAREVLTYIDYLHGRIVEACQLACQRLEPARVRWGLGRIDEAINRRQRDPDGKVTKIGWNPRGLVDPSVPVLQALRMDGSAIATIVGYGCHTVTTGIEYLGYSPDYPGPMRDFVRSATGGECVFLQGAGGNIMPRIAFEGTDRAMRRLGGRLGLEALHAVSDQLAQPGRLREIAFGSGTGLALFRWESSEEPVPRLAALEEAVDFPLLPPPTLEELASLIRKSEQEIDEATKRGATEGELRVLRFHGVNWARRIEKELRGGSPRTCVRGSVHAVRIGDGAIVTGPGEVFAEIGLAVKERSPAEVTLYAGYTNGVVSYLPTAAEFPLGGYETVYANKPFGLPSQVTPDCERILVETGVRLVRSLFPERKPPDALGWLASGRLPEPPPRPRFERPSPP